MQMIRGCLYPLTTSRLSASLHRAGLGGGGAAAAAAARAAQPHALLRHSSRLAAATSATPADGASTTSTAAAAASPATGSSGAKAEQRPAPPLSQAPFCRQCGSPMQVIRPPGDNAWRHVCTSQPCSYVDYFNPKAVVGCIVEHRGKILLCQR
jgi:hypothetical protein